MPKRDGIIREWRTLHNDVLKNLYSLSNIITMMKANGMRWAGNVARMDGRRNVSKVLVGKPEGKRSLGRPRSRCVDNIKINIREI
jgi:hypothetical protein